ncbi:GNAT family N-acetyltransferase [Mycobacterium sp. 050272]|uniref:GNAT family N-acetyltransferase n=1 Tax=Mycobacterium sp. 050272 TaxID=3142488 RepID=UPI00318BB781
MSYQLAEYSATARLIDGRLVSLRRLTAQDADATLAFHQRLTDFERYYRFFTLNQIDLEQLVQSITEASDDRYSLGAFDADRLIGVAHYVVVRDDPQVAEVAVAVAHEDHSLGIGTALLKHLAHIARAHGIERFVADVLSENHLMLTVLFDLGWCCKPTHYGAINHVEIELPDVLDELSSGANGIS